MRLILVRHGEALPATVDPERGLSEEGKRCVEKVACLLRGSSLEVDAIWHSGKKRARQTAEIMSSAVRARHGLVGKDGMAPLAPVEPVAEELTATGEDYLLAGHMPFLSRLTSLLVLGREEPDLVRFPVAGTVCLERDEEGHWTIGWMLVPGIL